jgi:hypothetical protein
MLKFGQFPKHPLPNVCTLDEIHISANLDPSKLPTYKVGETCPFLQIKFLGNGELEERLLEAIVIPSLFAK